MPEKVTCLACREWAAEREIEMAGSAEALASLGDAELARLGKPGKPALTAAQLRAMAAGHRWMAARYGCARENVMDAAQLMAAEIDRQAGDAGHTARWFARRLLRLMWTATHSDLMPPRGPVRARPVRGPVGPPIWPAVALAAAAVLLALPGAIWAAVGSGSHRGVPSLQPIATFSPGPASTLTPYASFTVVPPAAQ